MVRNRSRETSLVGILAALAALGQIGSATAQTYSVVGQSSVKTAATGRRPIADRIKAANRPIRIKAEADLAPDEGLIRELSTGDAPVRDWTPEPPVVEFSATTGPGPVVATTGPEPDAAATAATPTAAPSAEPAVVPPPVEGAIAANPTTSEGDDAVGEVTVLEGDSAEDAAPTGVNAAATSPTTVTPPVASHRRNVAPPRRAPARVTPERREALLERLRAALVEMPRPFGLVPMPAPAPTHHRPRSAMQKLPMPVAVTPVPTTVPAPEVPSPATVPTTDEALPEATPLADDTVTTEPALVEAVTPSDTPSSAAPASETVAADTASSEPEAVAIAPAAADTPAAVAPAVVEDANAEAGVASAEEGSATPPVAAATAPGTPSSATGARPIAPRRAAVRPVAPRTRAPQSIVQRQRPLERLQATVESFPRPLGILPAPRPAVRSQVPQARGPASVARGGQRPSSGEPGHVAAVARARPVPVAVPSDDDAAAVASTVPGTDAGDWTPQDGATAVDPGQVQATLAETAPAAPCIEVTLEGPEGSVVRGERVTLHLTVRNTGTVAARAVAPMIHFGAGIEPTASAGRTGRLTDEGSVVFEALPELAPGETVEVEVVAACETVGAVPFQAVVWCGEGESAEQVPVDGQLLVVPGRVATAPEAGLRR